MSGNDMSLAPTVTCSQIVDIILSSYASKGGSMQHQFNFMNKLFGRNWKSLIPVSFQSAAQNSSFWIQFSVDDYTTGWLKLANRNPNQTRQ